MRKQKQNAGADRFVDQWRGCLQGLDTDNVLILALLKKALSDVDAIRFNDLQSGRQLSWCQLLCSVARIYRYLHELNVSRGQRVVTISHNCWELLAIEFACQLKGAIYAPIYANYSEEVMTYCLSLAEPVLVITERVSLAQTLPQNTSWQVMTLEHSSTFTDFASIDSETDLISPDKTVSHEVVGEALLRALTTDLQATQAEQAFCLMFTSGSSGKPKGVLLSQSNILSQQQALQTLWHFDGPQSFLSYLPWHHSFGGLFEKYTAIFSQAMLHIDNSRGMDIARLCTNLSQLKPTRFFSVPKILTVVANKMKHSEDFQRAVAPTLQMIFSAASKLPADIEDYFNHCGIYVAEGWGLTETSPCLTLKGSDCEEHNSVGRPLPNVTLCIDEDSGEILAKGPNVMLGYYADEAANRRCFKQEWFRTGDLGKMVKGELVLLGRLDSVKKLSNGEKVSSDAIEQSLFEKTDIINHVIIDIEQRPYATALLFINPELCRQRFGENCTLQHSSRLQEHIVEVVQQHNHQVAESSLKLIAVAVTETSLSLAKGEVTPSFKVSQRTVRENYQVVRDALYDTSKPFHLNPACHSFLKITENHIVSSVVSEDTAPKQRINWETFVHIIGQVRGQELAEDDVQRSLLDLGYNSVTIIQLAASLSQAIGHTVTEVVLFSGSSIHQLWQRLVVQTSAVQATDESHLCTEDTTSLPPKQDNADVAIIGYAGRFPGAEDCDQLWENMLAGKSQFSRCPEDRPFMAPLLAEFEANGIQLSGAFCDDIRQFNHSFFEINPKDARLMDPQHRLLLMVTWEAIEQANLSLNGLKESRTGVFVGISQNGYRQLLQEYLTETGEEGYPSSAINNQNSVCANRLSYFLDLRGPSLTVDTLCSSSLVALHQARLSIERGECDTAIVAGVHLQLDMAHFREMQQLSVLSHDGICRPFDAKANGTVLGEGAGVVILKRHDLAIRDNNDVKASLLASEIYHGGRSNGITAPDLLAQQQLLEQCWANADVKASDIGYFETHGTGTHLGDPIEMAGIHACFHDQKAQTPCYLGAIKANIGHLEAAAGIAGLIKLLLIDKHRMAPPVAAFSELNPRITLAEGQLAIPTTAQPLAPEKTCLAVSAFGMGGTGAHVVIKSQSKKGLSDTEPENETLPCVLSGCDQAHLKAIASRLLADVQQHVTQKQFVLRHFCQALAQRTVLPVVCTLGVNSAEQLVEQLSAIVRGEVIGYRASENGPSIAAITTDKTTMALVFAGQGTQSVAMAAQLYLHNVQFAQWIDQIDQLCSEIAYESGQLKVEVKQLLIEPVDEQTINRTEFAQVILFAFEYALYQCLRPAIGRIDILLGHSLGEYVAACIANVFSLKEGLRIIIKRAQLMEASDPRGAMMMVNGTAEQVSALIENELKIKQQTELNIAAENSETNTIISGTRCALERFRQQLEQHGFYARFINTNRAFHSPMMSNAAQEFGAFLADIPLKAAEVPILSNLTGQPETECFATAEYWQQHMLGRVLFRRNLENLTAMTGLKIIEIGPKSMLGTWLMEKQPHHLASAYCPSQNSQQLNYCDLLAVLASDHLSGSPREWLTMYSLFTFNPALLPARKLLTETCWFTEYTATLANGARQQEKPDEYEHGNLIDHEPFFIMQQQIDCMNTIFQAQLELMKGK
ncbi:type I polyketide synthase [Xenorhabdus bovienii]|uniref:type I polyketide synthase n=1 Tax=Xenorhabdus bovienii TaxID=40576 RepID=UPI0004D4AFFF|nr:type I polyketide synthase [Xenorhabdus bovienii]CDG90455.1 Long-chain-fatty-acid--CoA ligase (polyketide synthase) [Xenorhabdus bovienii str. feltiae France]CDG91723.1 Long-chain-fatty-acid--CoA ligase (polyketide synthase) [Xenorhabdus bovienii str. feltiae Florida]